MRLRTQVGWCAAAVVCAAPAVLAPHAAGAQGFGLNEIGSCAIARGFATTGAPCDDASVLYWNPAAATRLRGLSIYGGVTGIQVKGRFTQDVTRRAFEGDVPVEYPPFLGVNWKGSGAGAVGRLALGVAAYVPYGLTSQWHEDFVGRFSAQKASLQTIYVQPNVAYEVVPGKLSLGAGLVIGHSTLELRQALDFSQQVVPGTGGQLRFAQLGFQPGTEFGRAVIKGSSTAYGFNLGAHLQATPTFAIGARYLSKVTFDYEGADATFTLSPLASSYVLPGGNALSAPAGTTLAQVVASNFAAGGLLAPGQQASTTLAHPAQFQVGIGYTGFANTTLSADYALVQYSSFQQLPVNFGATSPLTRTLVEDYSNSNSFRVGVDHHYRSGWAARAGFSYAQSPAPDETVTPLLPDMDRYNFALGAGIPLGRNFVLDAAYLRVETQGRRGRTSERPETLSAAETVRTLNNGWFALNANIFSASLKLQF